jgi:hypothetical protein
VNKIRKRARLKQAAANVRPIRQSSQYNCMSASMAMALRANGVPAEDSTTEVVNKVMGARPMMGASWEDALACAQHYGMRATLTVPATIGQIKAWTDQGIPVMIAWNPEGREWSHASLIFDVDDEGRVHIADPNIPDPDETVRVMPKAEFYGKWYEKASQGYLIRRPAMAIEREITSDGRQVVASSYLDFFGDRDDDSGDGSEVPWEGDAKHKLIKKLGPLSDQFRASELIKPSGLKDVTGFVGWWNQKGSLIIAEVSSKGAAQKIGTRIQKNLVSKKKLTSRHPYLDEYPMYIGFGNDWVMLPPVPKKVKTGPSIADLKRQLLRKGYRTFGRKGVVLKGKEGRYELRLWPALKTLVGKFKPKRIVRNTLSELDDALDAEIKTLGKLASVRGQTKLAMMLDDQSHWGKNARVDEKLMDRAAQILQYNDERATIKHLIKDGVNKTDAYLAVKAAKKLNEDRQKRLRGAAGCCDIYPNEIDHGYEAPLAGGTDVMQKLQNQLLHEQGNSSMERGPNHQIKSAAVELVTGWYKDAESVNDVLADAFGVMVSESVDNAVDMYHLKRIAHQAGIDLSEFDLKEVARGYLVEHEHSDMTQSDLDYLKIALAHLRELPDYYTRLKKMEEGKAAAELEQVWFEKTSSTSRECEIFKAKDGNWYMHLGDFEYADYEDCTTYGPFPSEEATDKFLRRNFSNPGGASYDNSGRSPVPKKSPNGRPVVNPARMSRWASQKFDLPESDREFIIYSDPRGITLSVKKEGNGYFGYTSQGTQRRWNTERDLITHLKKGKFVQVDRERFATEEKGPIFSQPLSLRRDYGLKD